MSRLHMPIWHLSASNKSMLVWPRLRTSSTIGDDLVTLEILVGPPTQFCKQDKSWIAGERCGNGVNCFAALVRKSSACQNPRRCPDPFKILPWRGSHTSEDYVLTPRRGLEWSERGTHGARMHQVIATRSCCGCSNPDVFVGAKQTPGRCHGIGWDRANAIIGLEVAQRAFVATFGPLALLAFFAFASVSCRFDFSLFSLALFPLFFRDGPEQRLANALVFINIDQSTFVFASCADLVGTTASALVATAPNFTLARVAPRAAVGRGITLRDCADQQQGRHQQQGGKKEGHSR